MCATLQFIALIVPGFMGLSPCLLKELGESQATVWVTTSLLQHLSVVIQRENIPSKIRLALKKPEVASYIDRQ